MSNASDLLNLFGFPRQPQPFAFQVLRDTYLQGSDLRFYKKNPITKPRESEWAMRTGMSSTA